MENHHKKFALAALLAAALAGCAMNGKQAEKAEAPEVKVALKDCPAAVQATLAREAPGVTITEVDKETDDGKTVYEANAVIAGKNNEIIVAEDGTLMSKKLDMEEEKKGDKKD